MYVKNAVGRGEILSQSCAALDAREGRTQMSDRIVELEAELRKCGDDARRVIKQAMALFESECKIANDLDERLLKAEDILKKAQAPKRPDGTYNYSREAFEQMANDYFSSDV